MDELVISVKRSRRPTVGPLWKDDLSKIEGVQIVGDDHAYSVQVLATQSARLQILRRYGAICHVNAVHYRRAL